MDGVQLPILNGDNHVQWKMRMEIILEAKGLLALIKCPDGTDTKGADFVAKDI